MSSEFGGADMLIRLPYWSFGERLAADMRAHQIDEKTSNP